MQNFMKNMGKNRNRGNWKWYLLLAYPAYLITSKIARGMRKD